MCERNIVLVRLKELMQSPATIETMYSFNKFETCFEKKNRAKSFASNTWVL